MSMFRLWRLFHRSGTRGTSSRTSALAIVAFASATAIFLTVLGGLHGFIWRASADHTFGCMINSFFKQKTAYEITWSDWSSDVCSSDLKSNGNPGSEIHPPDSYTPETYRTC